MGAPTNSDRSLNPQLLPYKDLETQRLDEGTSGAEAFLPGPGAYLLLSRYS